MTHEFFKPKRHPMPDQPQMPQTQPMTDTAAEQAAPAAPDTTQAQQLMARIQAEAAALQQTMPAFNLPRAMQEPRFVRLAAAGLSVQEAWMATQQPELLRQAYEAGVRQGRQQVALERNQARPLENGATPAGIVTGLDPANLSRAQRKDIRSRVRRGETVRF